MASAFLFYVYFFDTYLLRRNLFKNGEQDFIVGQGEWFERSGRAHNKSNRSRYKSEQFV